MRKLLLASMIGALIAGPALAAEIVLKVSHDANPDEPYHLGMLHFKKGVETATNGKVEVQVFPNAQLGEEIESIEGTLVGTVDLAVTSNSKLVNFVTQLSIFSLPFLFEGPAHMDKALASEPVVAKINEAMGGKGFRLIGLFSAGTRHIMTKEPIFSMEDLKGKKIRVMQTPAHVFAFNTFGANATPIAYNELYGALQTGVVDGAEAANTNYHSKKFYEVAPSWALVGWLEIVAPVIMGEKRFQKLPKDVQEAVLAAGIKAAEYQRQLYANSDQERFKMLQNQGVQVTILDPVPFRKASEKVYAKFLKTDFDRELLGLIKAAAK